MPSSAGTASTQGDRDATFPHRAAAVRVLGRRLGEDHRPRPLPDWRHRAQQPARTEAEPDRGGRGRHGGQHVTPRPAQPVPSGILTSTPAATATPRNQTRTASSRDPARRSPPRTVAAGTPRLAPIRRCPAPSARAVNAAQIHSAAYALRKSTTARHLASRPRLQRGAAQRDPVVVIQRDGQHVRGNRIAGTVQVFCGGLQRLFIEIASRTVFPSPVASNGQADCRRLRSLQQRRHMFCRWSFCVSDDNAATSGFAESHQSGLSAFVVFLADPKTVRLCKLYRATLGPGVSRTPMAAYDAIGGPGAAW